MSGEKKRGGLGLEVFKPREKPADDTEITKADAVAQAHGYTSREGNDVPIVPETRPPGRPVRKQPRKQLNFVANLEDIAWFGERREEMGVNGAKLFSEMRAAYQRENDSKN